MLIPALIVLTLAAASAQQAPSRDAQPAAATAVIRGRVLDAATGRPLRRATVNIDVPVGGAAGQRPSRTVSTNSDGIFEFREMPPGRYRVHVDRHSYIPAPYGQRRFSESGRPIELSPGQKIDDVVIRLLRMSVISGRITDEVGDPITGVTVMPLQSKFFHGRRRLALSGQPSTTDSTGYYRLTGLWPGEYLLVATTRDSWTFEEGGVQHVLAYVPTYYPGVTAPAEAQRLAVPPGEDVIDANFALLPGRRARVSGISLSSRGVPVGHDIQAHQEYRGPSSGWIVGLASTSNPDGSFVIDDVPPGEHVIRVQVPATPQAPAEFARLAVTVTGADIDGIIITTSPPVTVSGRLETDDGTSPPSFSSFRVTARPAGDDTVTEVRPSSDSGGVRHDGSFEMGPLHGWYQFDLTSLPDGWALKQVVHGANDVSIVPLDLRGRRPASDLRVIVTNRTATIAGGLETEDRKPAEGTVILFSVHREHWVEHSRFVRTARPDQLGRFRVRGLLPGDYYVVAVDFAEDGQWSDPEFLESLTEAATRVALAGREEKELTLVVKR